MILVPNEVAWLAENVGGFSRTAMVETPHGTYSELVVMTCLPLRESSKYGGDTDAIGMNPSDGTDDNRDLGLCQISNRWNRDKLRRFRWRDPYDNMRMARLVFDDTLRFFPERLPGRSAGFTAWHPFNKPNPVDPKGPPIYGAGNWFGMLAPAIEGVECPFEPVNPYTTAWKRG